MEIQTVLGEVLEIDILDITDIIQCTGLEPEFKETDLPISSNVYRYCVLVVDGERIPTADDFRTIWFKIKEDLQELSVTKVNPN